MAALGDAASVMMLRKHIVEQIAIEFEFLVKDPNHFTAGRIQAYRAALRFIDGGETAPLSEIAPLNPPKV